MEALEAKKPVWEQIKLKKIYELKAENKKCKFQIEIDNNEIIFELELNSENSNDNYIRKYEYNDIIKELKLPKDIYNNLVKIYNYFDIKEYIIMDDNRNKKIIINKRDEIILYKNINEIHENKDNKIKELENQIKKLKEEIYFIKDIIYKTEYKIELKYECNEGIQQIFGELFVKENKNNMDLIINGNKVDLIDKYKLKQGQNSIILIIKNKITNLSHMFDGCKSLKNIDELKYLNTFYCSNFSYMFSGCSSLSDIKALEKWNVSNGNFFSYMFSGCSSLSDIKALEKWNVSNGNNFQIQIILVICSVDVHLYPILKL